MASTASHPARVLTHEDARDTDPPFAKVTTSAITANASAMDKGFSHARLHSQPGSIANAPPPSSVWRESIALTSKRNKENIVTTASIRVPNIEKYATSVQAFAETPYLAVGCASETNNLFIVENLSPATIDPFETPENTGLKTRSAFSVPDPIFKMSFSGDRLVTAGPNSRLQLFKIDLKEIGTRGKGLEHLFDCKLNSGKLSDVKVAPPGTRVASVRIHEVEFMPCPKDALSPRFLALEGRKLFVWDITASKVVASEMVSFDQLMSASWSPHQPYGSLIAASGVDHHLSVLDARLMGMDTEKGVIWKVERAHGGRFHPSITSVKFNPFVPFWLASTGEDSIVRVWDLRYLKNPAGKVEGHYKGIQSMAWSNTHAEILVTGSTDCSVRAWCFDSSVITPIKSSKNAFVGSPSTDWGEVAESKTYATASDITEPMRSRNELSLKEATGMHDVPFCVGAKMIADVSTFSGPVISINASWSHLDTFYCLSSIGELSSVTLRPDLFKATTPHRFDSTEYPLEHCIETAVYSRDLKGAFQQVAQLSKTSLTERRTFGKNERKMIELCTAKEAIDPASWAVANRGGLSLVGTLRKVVGQWKDEGKEGGLEMVERFKKDLEEFTYYIPPRFGEFKRWYDLIPTKTRLDLEMVILRFNTLVDVSKKNWESVLKAEQMVCKGIENDPSFMEPDYLKLLIESVLPNDYLRGLSMAYNLAQSVDQCGSPQSPSRFPQLSGLVGLSLFPTVFESATWITDPSNLERRWSDGRGPKMRQIWVRGFLDDNVKLAALTRTAVDPNQKLSKQGVITSSDAIQIEYDRKRSIAIGNLLSDSKSILRMISTEIRVLKLLGQQGQNEDLAEELIRIVTGESEADTSKENGLSVRRSQGSITEGNKFAYRTTISVTTNRLYLDSLLLTKRFEEYFGLCNDFCINYQSYEFPKAILRHAEITAIPKLKSHIDNLYAKATTHVADALQLAEKATAQPTSVVGQTMTGGTKPLREGMVSVVKISVIIAQLIEMKGVLDKEGVELAARCAIALNMMLGYVCHLI
ncbi:hypothetical protein BC830DRAFT_1127577 [Chytriomyces sp. MP71]|nr:hypothetical protein BC830DRAFT_1127577 [Chytriomyces sp. MP71]